MICWIIKAKSIFGAIRHWQVLKHTILLHPGDRLFLFTDGITDQFGGEKGKKLGRVRLRNACLKCSPGYVQQKKPGTVFKKLAGDLNR